MELFGLLLILTAIADKVGRAIGWCLVTLVKGYAILLLAIARFIIAEIKRRQGSSTEEKSGPAAVVVNPNIDDAIAALKRLGLPQGAAQKSVGAVAAEHPAASAADLIKLVLKSLDKNK